MKIKREVLVDSVLLKRGKSLKVGDKVRIRLTIIADRDYDFVQVVDKRAACLEPVSQLSGYHWGYYIAPKDYTTNYYFDQMAKGKHVVETEYYMTEQVFIRQEPALRNVHTHQSIVDVLARRLYE